MIVRHVKNQKPSFGELGIIGLAQEPFEIVHIDTKSGFKGLGSNKNNLHLAIDTFSRFVQGVSSTTKTYVDFINLINKLITIQKPKLILTDKYPAIKSKYFQDFFSKIKLA